MFDVSVTSPLGQGTPPLRKAKYGPKEKKRSPPPVLVVCLTSCILRSSSPVLFSFLPVGLIPMVHFQASLVLWV